MTEPAVVYTGVELSVDDVVTFTDGRLEDNDRTEVLLAQMLAAARTYCGWHVNPVHVDEEIVVDGPGGYVLALPTMQLLEVSELVEDGFDIVDDLIISTSGLIRKVTGAYWSTDYGAIQATITHGYDQAADWRGAVLSAVDRSSYGDARLTAGPFSYSPAGPAGGSVFSLAEKAVLDMYRLEPLA